MARGWESKAVEDQMASAAAVAPARERLTQEQINLNHKRASLMLERTRVMHDLELAHNPRHQQMLRLALAHLDARLTEL